MLTNKMHFLNQSFNSIPLAFYMSRISYVHHQEDYTVHAALYADDEHKIFETCRRQEELN
jgi:hypothetical protein